MAARDYNEGFLDGLEYAFELGRKLPEDDQSAVTLMDWIEASAKDRGYRFKNSERRDA